jgi:small subunit ribosomal protein S26e
VYKLAKKRKSGGRATGKGRSVQCSKCGRKVPIDKAKKVTKRISLVERDIERDIRKQDGYIPTTYRVFYYCVSCAVHTHTVNIRPDKYRDIDRPEKEQKKETQDAIRGMEKKEYGDKKDEIKKDRRYDSRRTSKRKETTK